MKKRIYSMVFCLTVCLAYGQGTFIYDQQSATESTIQGNGFEPIEMYQPMGQSFTPTLSSVGFIRLLLADFVSNGTGATVYLNLWSGSIGGTLLATSSSVSIPDNFGTYPRPPGFTNFFFSTPVTVTPGVTYYFQPQLKPGSDDASVNDYNAYLYSGGTMIRNGAPVQGFDLWFREGIYAVPEPSPSWLIFLSSVLFFYVRNKNPKCSANSC